jgi:RNase P/RNase MRP subunit POP5
MRDDRPERTGREAMMALLARHPRLMRAVIAAVLEISGSVRRGRQRFAPFARLV